MIARNITRSLLLLFGIFSIGYTFAEEIKTPTSLKLVFEDRILQLNFNTHPQLLKQETQHFLEMSGVSIALDMENLLPEIAELLPIQTKFTTVIDPNALHEYFTLSSFVLKEEGSPLEIQLNEKGQILFEGGSPEDGFTIDYDRLTALLNHALKKGSTYIRVPAKKIFSPVIVAPELEERGIKEIIAIGESNFTGSSPARRQNILAAIKKYNGLIIPQGETFSFNKILKSVDAKDGFVPEMVIKGDKTEKEFGGGVCQVSTTVFRAAFNGGFPLVNRRNHSYAVPYYKPFGLDATIYLGAQDFQFKNDTPGDLLIQSYVKGDDLHFIFYGTSDGRKVKLEGPFVSNYRNAPDPKVFETAELPYGQEKIASEGHAGFRAEWVRHIEKEGQIETDNLVSNYRPWAAQVIRGIGSSEQDSFPLLQKLAQAEDEEVLD